LGGRALCDGDGHIETVVVYGLITNPETVTGELEPLPTGETFLLSNRFAIFSETAPALRLSSAGWIDLTPNSLIGIDTPELLFELCKEKIIARIQPFSKRIRLFVERYFEFMKAQIAEHASELDSDDIFAVEDWIYSAWLPLPHAHIQLPTGFAELDTAFWTGEQLIGVQVEQTGSIAKSKREKLVYLEEHHPQIKIISIPRDGLLESGDGFPSDLFGEDFSCFWKGLTLPQGPSPSKILMKSFNAPPTN
jgi:hypothetical protein